MGEIGQVRSVRGMRATHDSAEQVTASPARSSMSCVPHPTAHLL